MKNLIDVFQSYKEYVQIADDFYEKFQPNYDKTRIEFMHLLRPVIDKYIDKIFPGAELSYISSMDGSKGVRAIYVYKDRPDTPHYHYIELKDLMEYYEREVK